MLTATGQDGRPAGSTGPIRRGTEYFPFAISRRPLSGEILLISPVRELGGTSTIHLAVAGGGHIGRADGLRRRALRLQERGGDPVAGAPQAGSGQCCRPGAAPPDGGGGGCEQRAADRGAAGPARGGSEALERPVAAR